MKVVAIDTSTKTQALALTDGSRVVARRLTVVRTNHSESLLANISDMLRQAEWLSSDVELVAVGLGPGTFTGLRVGLATAKAIARSHGAGLVGVSSLAATARPIATLFQGHIVALCDARRGEVYTATYRADGREITEVEAARAMTPTAVRSSVEALNGPVTLVGNGLRAFPELQQWDLAAVQVMPQPWDPPSSVSIALLGAAEFDAQGGSDIAALEPDYVRASDAEINLANRSK